jgi:putative transcriptional regulator
MENKIGQLLVASFSMPYPAFRRTCIAVIDDGDQGTIGICVNRPTSKSVEEMCEKGILPGVCEINSDDVIYSGGPVKSPLAALHPFEKFSEKVLCPGVFVSVNPQYLAEIVKNEKYRLYVGCVGWQPGQLDIEIQAGGWISIPCEEKYVFYEETKQMYEPNVWRKSIRHFGKLLWQKMGIKHCPDDPTVN